MLTKSDVISLLPALLFGAVLGITLLAAGDSLSDTLLAVCAAYGLVSLLDAVWALDSATSHEQRR